MRGLLVGSGNMGRNHARLLASSNHVSELFLVDPNHESIIGLANNFVKCFKTVDEALSENSFDFAVIAAPTKFHFTLCKQLIMNKIHILVEKPITENVETALELKALAMEHGVKLLPGHIERYNPAIMFLKSKLKTFDLGSVYRIEVLRCSPFPPRITDVGVAFDLSVHDLDVINFLFGKKVVSLFCRSSQKLHDSQEDGVISYLNYENKIDCVMNTNWTSPLKKRMISIYGAWGMFTVDFISQEVVYYENPSHIADQGTWGWTGISEGEQIKYNVPKSEPLKNEHEHFFNGILKDLSFEEEINSSINVVKVVSKFHVSNKEKREIEIE